jgi:acyl-CoA synthetase (AMP-forming)/AMP-acid ligase II
MRTTDPVADVRTDALDGAGSPATLAQALANRAVRDPDEVAYEFLLPDGTVATITVGELYRRALATAEPLRDDPTRPPALIMYPPGIEYLVALWACLLSGVPAVPAYPPTGSTESSVDRIRRQAADARARWVIAAPESAEALRRTGDVLPPACEFVTTAAAHAESAALPTDPMPAAGDVALIQYTSGSTRRPRGVVLSHRNLVANIKGIIELFELDRASRGLLWLPPYHDMGLIGGILTPLYLGMSIRLMSPVQFLKNPMSWINQISAVGATISGGPNFAYDLVVRQCREGSVAGLDVSSWRVALNGAEPVRRATLERFAAALRPAGFDPGAFLPCYGLAEATLLVTGAHWRPRAEPHDRVSCGPPVAGNRLAIVGADTGVELPEGEEGEIWVDGPGVSAGYWAGPGQPVDAHGLRELGGRVYLRTGDLGLLRHGELVVTGRRADVLVRHGANYHASDVEYVATARCPDVRPAAAAFLGEPDDGEPPVVLVVERAVAGGAPSDIAAHLRAEVVANLGLRVDVVVLCPPRTVPRTSSGKVQRGLCRRRYLAGEYEAWIVGSQPDRATAPAPDDGAVTDVAGFVAGVFAAVCEVTECGVDDHLSAIGGDSLRAATIAGIVERAAGLTLPVEAVLTAGTPRAVTARLVATGAPQGLTAARIRQRLHDAARAPGNQ